MPERDTDVPRCGLYGETNTSPRWSIHLERIEKSCQPDGQLFHPHRHKLWVQFFLITNGDGILTLKSTMHGFHEGHVLVIPRDHAHGLLFTAQTKGWVLTIDHRYLGGLCKRNPGLKKLTAAPGVFDLGLNFVQRAEAGLAYLDGELNASSSGSHIGADLHLVAILLGLLSHWPKQGHQAHTRRSGSQVEASQRASA